MYINDARGKIVSKKSIQGCKNEKLSWGIMQSWLFDFRCKGAAH